MCRLYVAETGKPLRRQDHIVSLEDPPLTALAQSTWKQLGWGWWFYSLLLFILQPLWRKEPYVIILWRTREKWVCETETKLIPKHKHVPMGLYWRGTEISFVMFTKQPAHQTPDTQAPLTAASLLFTPSCQVLHSQFACLPCRATGQMLNLGDWDRQFIFWNRGYIFAISPWKI